MWPTIFLVLLGLLVLGSLIGLGFLVWSCVPGRLDTMIADGYIFTVENGMEIFLTSSPIKWPFTRNQHQVGVTFAFQIPATTPTNPSLPIILVLPTPATNLIGTLIMTSHPLPAGQTDLIPVQFGLDTVAFRYEPSGLYATGAELTTAWNLVFDVLYTIPN